MAKIVLVTEHFHQTASSLARALRSQNHEVVVLTSRNESIDGHADITFMTYFQSWSLIEALRLFPVLLGTQAQIYHLLLDSDTLNSAQSAIAFFAKSYPHCVLTTSLLHIRRGLHKRNPVRYLLQESDIVTCPTVETMGHLRGLPTKRSQGRGILPPILSLSEELSGHQNEIVISETPLLELLEKKKYILIPFRETQFDPDSEFAQRLRQLAEHYHLVLWGSMAVWPLRTRKVFQQWMLDQGLDSHWTVTGIISAGTTEHLMEHAEALWLAGQVFTAVEMTDFYLKAIHSHTSLVLSRRQAQVHAALWKHGKNCWILEDRKMKQEMVELLKMESLKTPEFLPESIAREKQWIDIPLNDLNRLYNKALMSK